MRSLLLILLLAGCGPRMPSGCPSYFDQAGRNEMFEQARADQDLDQWERWFNCLPPQQQCDVLDELEARFKATAPLSLSDAGLERPAHCAQQ